MNGMNLDEDRPEPPPVMTATSPLTEKRFAASIEDILMIGWKYTKIQNSRTDPKAFSAQGMEKISSFYPTGRPARSKTWFPFVCGPKNGDGSVLNMMTLVCRFSDHS